MKKVNILLVLAGLFIAGVMLYLVGAGVKQRKRKMVTWSSVESPQMAGQKVARFFFPILKEQKRLIIEKGPGLAEEFHRGFADEAKKISPETHVVFEKERSGLDDFQLLVRPLNKKLCEEQCQKGLYRGCVCLGAIKKFNKKKRNSNQLWIHMVRLRHKLAVLFFVEPKS